MAITIQEILASDTISEMVNKININFDQLLLNGGGPPGGPGLQGIQGIPGPNGPAGNRWFTGLTDPNTLTFNKPLEDGDLYLQANGDVWEYSESPTGWTLASINLQGPPGIGGGGSGSGSSVFELYNSVTEIVGDIISDIAYVKPDPDVFSSRGHSDITAVLIGGLPQNAIGSAGVAEIPFSNLELSSANSALFIHSATGNHIIFSNPNSATSSASLPSIVTDSDDTFIINNLKTVGSNPKGIVLNTTESQINFESGDDIIGIAKNPLVSTPVPTLSANPGNIVFANASRYNDSTGANPQTLLRSIWFDSDDTLLGEASVGIFNDFADQDVDSNIRPYVTIEARDRVSPFERSYITVGGGYSDAYNISIVSGDDITMNADTGSVITSALTTTITSTGGPTILDGSTGIRLQYGGDTNLNIQSTYLETDVDIRMNDSRYIGIPNSSLINFYNDFRGVAVSSNNNNLSILRPFGSVANGDVISQLYFGYNTTSSTTSRSAIFRSMKSGTGSDTDSYFEFLLGDGSGGYTTPLTLDNKDIIVEQDIILTASTTNDAWIGGKSVSSHGLYLRNGDFGVEIRRRSNTGTNNSPGILTITGADTTIAGNLPTQTASHVGIINFRSSDSDLTSGIDDTIARILAHNANATNSASASLGFYTHDGASLNLNLHVKYNGKIEIPNGDLIFGTDKSVISAISSNKGSIGIGHLNGETRIWGGNGGNIPRLRIIDKDTNVGNTDIYGQIEFGNLDQNSNGDSSGIILLARAKTTQSTSQFRSNLEIWTADGASSNKAVTVTYNNNITIENNLYVSNGTALSPSISFTNDSDTGIYRNASNTIGFSGGGEVLGKWTFAGASGGTLTVNQAQTTAVPAFTIVDGDGTIGSELWFNVISANNLANDAVNSGDAIIAWNPNGKGAPSVADNPSLVIAAERNRGGAIAISDFGATSVTDQNNFGVIIGNRPDSNGFYRSRTSGNGGSLDGNVHACMIQGAGGAPLAVYTNSSVTNVTEYYTKHNSGIFPNGSGPLRRFRYGIINDNLYFEKLNGPTGGEILIQNAADGDIRFNVTSGARQIGGNKSYSILSDQRIKTNINTINNGIEVIKKLNPVIYNRIDLDDKTTNYIGFIAQEVEKIIPEAINTGTKYSYGGDADGNGETVIENYKSISYDNIFTYAVKAIKEQQDIIEEKQNKINELETRLAAIEAHLGL